MGGLPITVKVILSEKECFLVYYMGPEVLQEAASIEEKDSGGMHGSGHTQLVQLAEESKD